MGPAPWALAYRAFKATRFFGSLDGLRALSILAVIWFHTVPWDRATLLGQGNKGVTLFFAISGFLIVTLLLRQKDRRGTIDLRNFWGRRALRIFPVYYLALALYVVLVALVERDPAARSAFWGNLPAFATFTSNWFVDLENARVIFYFAWSLAAEEQFYLLWPLVERFAPGRRPLLIAGAVLLVTQAVALAWPLASRTDLSLRMLTSVPAAILFGVMLAHLLHEPRTFRPVWAVLGRRGSAFGAVAAAVLALAFAPTWGALGEAAIALALAAVVAACVVREDNDLARVAAATDRVGRHGELRHVSFPHGRGESGAARGNGGGHDFAVCGFCGRRIAGDCAGDRQLSHLRAILSPVEGAVVRRKTRGGGAQASGVARGGRGFTLPRGT